MVLRKNHRLDVNIEKKKKTMSFNNTIILLKRDYLKKHKRTINKRLFQKRNIISNIKEKKNVEFMKLI